MSNFSHNISTIKILLIFHLHSLHSFDLNVFKVVCCIFCCMRERVQNSLSQTILLCTKIIDVNNVNISEHDIILYLGP